MILSEEEIARVIFESIPIMWDHQVHNLAHAIAKRLKEDVIATATLMVKQYRIGPESELSAAHYFYVAYDIVPPDEGPNIELPLGDDRDKRLRGLRDGEYVRMIVRKSHLDASHEFAREIEQG